MGPIYLLNNSSDITGVNNSNPPIRTYNITGIPNGIYTYKLTGNNNYSGSVKIYILSGTSTRYIVGSGAIKSSYTFTVNLYPYTIDGSSTLSFNSINDGHPIFFKPCTLYYSGTTTNYYWE